MSGMNFGPEARVSEWMLCERCHFSWLRNPATLRPTHCPECRSPEPTVVSFGDPE